MNCTICHKPIILVPSAQERAKKYGGKPSDYTKLFTMHSECYLKKNADEVCALMEQKNEEFNRTHHNKNLLVPNRAI